VFIYGGLHLIKTYSVSQNLQRCLKFIQSDLWGTSKCYIQMRPRLRMAYVAGMASFVPYMTKQAALKSNTLLLLNVVVFSDDPHRLLTYPVSICIGFSTGVILSSLIFSFQPAYWIMGGLIGLTHSCAHTFVIRQEIRRGYEKLMRESHYQDDENFTL